MKKAVTELARRVNVCEEGTAKPGQNPVKCSANLSGMNSNTERVQGFRNGVVYPRKGAFQDIL